jgi:aspartyl protease family protein
MLRLAAIGAISTLLAAAAARAMLLSLDHSPQPQPPAVQVAAAPAPAPVAPPPDSGDAATIAKSSDGHFWADADIDGHDVRFLVDTGASAVSLTPDDAERLGFSPGSLAYNYQVSTANGQTVAARVKLDRISVAGAEVRDVDAYVIQQGLPTSLLGMSYLGRLSQFEATQSALILRP